MKIKSIKKVNIPDGEYKGIVGGYQLKIEGQKDEVELSAGVRGMNIHCKVEVENGEAVITI